MRVKQPTWTRINHRREPGDSMNDVLDRVLEKARKWETVKEYES